MPNLIPVLYVPTIEDRAAAYHALVSSGLYIGGKPAEIKPYAIEFNSWESAFGKTRHWIRARSKPTKHEAWFFTYQGNIDQSLSGRCITKVNTPAHFISCVKRMMAFSI